MSETPLTNHEIYTQTPELQPAVAVGAFEHTPSVVEDTRRSDYLSGAAQEAAHQAGEIAMVYDITARLKQLRKRKIAEPREVA